jgi:hypothetical protein
MQQNTTVFCAFKSAGREGGIEAMAKYRRHGQHGSAILGWLSVAGALLFLFVVTIGLLEQFGKGPRIDEPSGRISTPQFHVATTRP